MVDVSTVENELREVTSVKPRKKEGRQVFLARLAEAVDGLGDEWDDLSQDAQDWVNKALTAMKGADDVLEFSNSPGEDEPKPKPKPKSKGKAKGKDKDKDKDKAAAPAEKDADAGGGTKRTGVKIAIKKLLWENPKMSADEIADALEKGGHNSSMATVRGIRAEFHHTLRVLNDLGVTEADL